MYTELMMIYIYIFYDDRFYATVDCECIEIKYLEKNEVKN